MTTKIISLPSGYSYFTFQSALGSNVYTFNVRWLTRFSYYVVCMYDSTGAPVFQGRGLHPNMDLLSGLQLGVGSLFLRGEAATVANLGISNTLTWEY